jgi:hypothetical protein
MTEALVLPVYTYECVMCADEIDLVHRMSEAGKTQFCADCGSPLLRVYRAPQVSPDRYSSPLVLDTLPSLHGKHQYDPDVAESRSDLARLLREHKEKHGRDLRVGADSRELPREPAPKKADFSGVDFESAGRDVVERLRSVR